MIIALPTTEKSYGGMRVRDMVIRYPASESRDGTSHFPPPPPRPPNQDSDTDTDEIGGEDSGEDSGDESDTEVVLASGSISAGLPLQTGIQKAESNPPMRIQSPEEETKEHWMIAMGSVGTFAPSIHMTIH